MKDEADNITIDAFTAPAVQSHYQALRPYTGNIVSGNRWAGSKTPDAIRQQWATPDWMFNYLNKRYGEFTVDAAASENNKKCERFFSEKDDALKQEISRGEKVFLNPPFGDIEPWILWVIDQVKRNKCSFTVVLPHDISTRWARMAVINSSEIIHVISDGVHSGRVSFLHPVTGVPMGGNNKGTMICHFNHESACAKNVIS